MDRSGERIDGLIYPHEMSLFTILLILIEIKKKRIIRHTRRTKIQERGDLGKGYGVMVPYQKAGLLPLSALLFIGWTFEPCISPMAKSNLALIVGGSSSSGIGANPYCP